MRRALVWTPALTVAFLLAGELAARTDDWIREDISVLASPSYDDLILKDSLGVRGRPHGHFKKWHLNNAGFRSPKMTPAPLPGCARVVVLGTSETFGYYEPEGREYPAQLADSLRRFGCYEVLNAGVAGLAIPGVYRLWRNWVRMFRPDIVVIYPSPAFYLSDNTPALAPYLHVSEGPQPPSVTSRLWLRLLDRVEVPGPLQRQRTKRAIAAATAGKPPEWAFNAPPQDRLNLFHDHLDSLASSVRATGASIVMTTHATIFADTTGAPEPDLALAWRQAHPRPSPATLIAFDRAASPVIAAVAARNGAALLDLGAAMNGCPAWFADFLHFSEAGASVVATLMAPAVAAAPVARLGWPGKPNAGGPLGPPASCPTVH